MLAPAPDQVLPSRAEAERFLAALDPADQQRFTFQTFDDDPDRKDKSLATIRHGNLARHWRELARHNQLGAGIFVAVNITDLKGRAAENVIKVRALFVDLDGAPLDPAATCSNPPHIIVESSPGRWHCYWIVSDLPLDAFGPMQRALAVRFGGDKVHDLPRVLRLPGFVHRKKAPFLSLLQDVDPRPPYTFEQLRAAFPPAPQPTPPTISDRALARVPARAIAVRSGDLRPTLHRVHGLLRTLAQAPDGKRNNVLYWACRRVSDMCRADDLDIPAGTQALEALRQVATQVGLTQREIECTITSALRSSS